MAACFHFQMSQYFLDDHGVFDAGNDLHRPFALFALSDVNTEDSFEAACPGHRGMLLHGRALIRFGVYCLL